MERLEQNFIQPLAPGLREATDLWPEFSLRDVRITSQLSGKPISLLSAHVNNPVQVEGILEEVDPAHEHLGTHRSKLSL